MPINKRLKRELKKNFAKYFLIGLVMFLGMTLISAFFSSTDRIMETINDERDKCNVEDANVSLISVLSEENKDKIFELGVNKLEDTSYVDMKALDESDYELRVFKVREAVDKLSVTEGRLPQNKDEIALEIKTAAAKKLSVGDEAEVGEKTYTVSGIVTVVDYNNVLQTISSGVSNLKAFGIGFVSKEAFDAIDSSNVNIQYSFTVENEECIDKVSDYLKDESLIMSVLKRVDNPRIESIGDKTKTLKAEIILISIVFVFLISFIFYAMSSALVDKDSTFIGTLFSMGYTRAEIVRHYIILPFVITLIGSVLGMLAGTLFFAEMIGKTTYSSYSLPTFSGKVNIYLVIICCIVPLVIQLLTNCLLLTRKLKISPSELMRGKGRSGRGFRMVNLENRSFPVKMYIRIMLRGIKNQFILFFGIVIAMFLLIMGFGMKDTLVEYVDDVKENSLYEYSYILNAPVLPESGDDYDKATIEGFKVEYAGISMDLTVYGLKDSSRVQEITPNKDEIVISDSTASKLSLDKGDTLKVYSEKLKKDIEFKVTDVIHDPVGLSAYMDRTAINVILENDEPEEYYNVLLSDMELSLPDGSLVEMVTHTNQIRAAEEMNDMMQPMIIMLIVVALIVFVAVMYMLLKMIIEKSEYSISLMKIFGYTNKESNHFYMNSFFITVIISLILSLIIDKVLFTAVWPTLNSNLVGFVPIKIHFYTYALILALGVICYLVVTVLLRAKLKRIPMNMVLKQRN
ncbi:MAG: ABC transporter permease [Oscillospiraceae bacterium]|nr:ABC transporter permease [Oscillospiraceae bacterium]